MDSLEDTIVSKEMLKVTGETKKIQIFCEGLTLSQTNSTVTCAMQIESETWFDLHNKINCKWKASEALTKLNHEQEAQGPQWSPEQLCTNSIQPDTSLMIHKCFQFLACFVKYSNENIKNTNIYYFHNVWWNTCQSHICLFANTNLSILVGGSLFVMT